MAAFLLLSAGPALLPTTLLHSPAKTVDRLGTPVSTYTFGNAEERRMMRAGGGYETQEAYGSRGRGDRYNHGQGPYGDHHMRERGDHHMRDRGYGMRDRDYMAGYGMRGHQERPFERNGMTGSLRQNDVQSPYGIKGRDDRFGLNQDGSYGGTGRERYGAGMMPTREDMMREGMGMRRGRYGGFERGEFDRFDMQRDGYMQDGFGRGGRFSDYGNQIVDRYGGVGRRGHLELD